ncbi:MAG: C1 family peptidase [Bacteroidales bacterium]|nr:C1 family peptidase [Candidatus Cryptobacteroides equifaecalis]
MKKISIIIAMMAAAITAFAQTKGSITPEMLDEIKTGYQGTASDKALRNALNTTAINVLAANAENIAMINTDFTDRVKTKGITNQKQSGRCWLFTGLNVLRAAAIEKHNLGEFQFSQNYCFFWDQLEKANLFLQAIIDTRDLDITDRRVDWLFSNPIGDGGTFTGVANLVTKYGVVPSDVMPETLVSNATNNMSSQLRTLLRQDGLRLRETPAGMKAKDVPAYLQKQKTAMLKEVYHILALCLGVPPTEFEYKGKTYTPQQFYAEMVGFDLENNYVMLMNDPSREYGKVYEIEYDRHTYDGQNWLYVNLPVERIKEMAIASIKDNKAMYFSCDVGKFLDRPKGVADLKNFDYESLLGVKFTMDKKERILTHASGSSHAMTLIAVDLKDGVPQKWMVENSWGNTGYNGFLIMTDEWFNEYMFRLVVEKMYVPEDVKKMLEQKPVKLPSWDPMFLGEE